jgi:hypothetical protein
MHKGVIGSALSVMCVVMSLALGPGIASAATNPYSPRDACGSSYYVLESLPVQTTSGATWGRVYLMYSATTKKNCVVTLKSAYVGTRTTTIAYVESANGQFGYDRGNYAYYANAYVYSPGYCVAYSGEIFSGANSTGTSAGATSRWGWCN